MRSQASYTRWSLHLGKENRLDILILYSQRQCQEFSEGLLSLEDPVCSKDNRLNTNAEPTVRLSLEVGSQGEADRVLGGSIYDGLADEQGYSLNPLSSSKLG